MKGRAEANNYPSPKVIDLNRGNVVSISESHSGQMNCDVFTQTFSFFLSLTQRNGENVMEVILIELLAGPEYTD